MKKSKTSKKPAEKQTVEPTKEDKFSYCVGHPWPKGPLNPDGASICIYAHHTEIQYGTMSDAERFRDYVNEQTRKENFIYKLVPVETKRKKAKT